MQIFRVKIGNEYTIAEFTDKVHNEFVNCLDNTDVHFEELLRTLQPKRLAGRNPIYDVVFAFFNNNDTHNFILPLKQIPFETGNIKTDLRLGVDYSKSIIDCKITYSSELFKESTIRNFVGLYTNIIEEIIVNPNISIIDLHDKANMTSLVSTKHIRTNNSDFNF